MIEGLKGEQHMPNFVLFWFSISVTGSFLEKTQLGQSQRLYTLCARRTCQISMITAALAILSELFSLGANQFSLNPSLKRATFQP